MGDFKTAYSKLDIPIDAEGYTKSFSNPEDADIAQFFDKYGFVVIDGVLSAEECEESIDEFWGYVEGECMRRPGEPCFLGTVTLEQPEGFVVLPAMCAANGKRDAGTTVKGSLKMTETQDSGPGGQDCVIAVIKFDTEVGAYEKIQACIESGAKGVILVDETGPIQKLNCDKLDALSVPVVVVNAAVTAEEASTATIAVDAKGTWTFPRLPAPYKFELRGLELGVDRQVAGKVRRQDPATWNEEHGWDIDEEGMIGLPPVWTKKAMENRQAEKLYRASCTLLGISETVVSIDRFAIFRPMRLPEAIDEWATADNIHLDMDPWRYYGIPTAACSGPEGDGEAGISETAYDWEGDFMKEHNVTPFGAASKASIKRIQGLINMVDNKKEDGGFQVVAGAHKSLEAWALQTKDSDLAKSAEPDFNILHWNYKGEQEQTDPTPMCGDRQRITLRAGSVIFWDYKLPHGSFPNNSTTARIAQFFKVIPAAQFSHKSLNNRGLVTRPIVEASGCTLTESGRKFLALSKW